MADDRIVERGILQGEITVPGDKSVSHRALILGALAQGQTTLSGFLPSEDCYKTLKALMALGVLIKQTSPSQISIQGVSLDGLQAPLSAIDCGNSGTTLRLLAGVLAAQPFASTLLGDSSLSSRPMDRIITPLQKMGAILEGFPPLSIFPASVPLEGITYTLPVASAQVKSCLLLAGLYAKTPTAIIENTATRDHTERLLQTFGASLAQENNKIVLTPGATLYGQPIDIPGDFSSAAFFIAAASMTPGSHLVVRGVGVNPLRTGILSVLRAMGGSIMIHPCASLQGEPVADIEVWGANLRGITIPPELVVSSIDEFPIIFIVAAGATGETHIRGIQELRTKETDRIAVMAAGLRALGIMLEEYPDGITIQGAPHFGGGQVQSEGDHRVAMAFAMAGLRAKAPVMIKECDNIATSFPNFWALAARCGLVWRQA